MIEIYFPVYGYENKYLVSTKGNVKAIKSNRIMSKINHNLGYLRTRFFDSMKYNHALVMESIVGQRPDGMVINHIDGNKKNNCLENLEYCSQKENQQHAAEIGLYKKGENHGSSKLTRRQVECIIFLFNRGLKNKSIAKIYGVTENNILKIKNGHSWKHVSRGF